MKRVMLGLVLLLSIGCASARHIAVTIDATFATAIFAIDDAEYTACKTHADPFTPAVCAAADPLVLKALVDVKAVTAAIQATPANGKVPTSLPALLSDLTNLQGVLTPLSPSIIKTDVSTKIEVAISQAIAILNAILGAK